MKQTPRTLLVVAVLAIGLFLVPPAAVTLAVTLMAASVAPECGPGGGVDAVLHLDAEQLANAETVVLTTYQLHLPQRAAQVAVATALQESSLRNLDHGDRAGPTSRGLFQQKIEYYGLAVATDPVRATTAFLKQLLRVRDWQTVPLTQAAATVQRPRADLRDAYARWESNAGVLTLRYWPTEGGQSTIPPTQAVRCAGEGGDGLGGGGRSSLPDGFVLPTAGQSTTAIRFALAQVGKPYVWGGVGPHGFDCSGLTMKAWSAAGVGIPRTAATQSSFGQPVTSVAMLHPGDLIFIAGSHGSAARPGHVGMYLGMAGGQRYIVQAPHTGDHVRVDPLSRWDGLIVAMRRPVDR